MDEGYPRLTPWCPHLNKYTGRLLQRDGGVQVKDYCPDCDQVLSGAKKATKLLRLTLPVFRDNRVNPDTPCDRCGENAFLQRHHWAPRALFGWDEAETWPTSDLCQNCHSTWHRIVTPNIRRKVRQ